MLGGFRFGEILDAPSVRAKTGDRDVVLDVSK